MRKLIKPGRITALVVMLVALLGIYVYFLYQVQIVEGTERYNSATPRIPEPSPPRAAISLTATAVCL